MIWKHFHDLQKARPNLRLISPLRFWLVVGFIIFNSTIAHILWIQPAEQGRLAIYNEIFTHKFYAVVFVILALSLLMGLLFNSWKLIKKAMLAGLFVKALFAYALVQLGIQYGFTTIEGTTALWLMIMWVQFWLYIDFEPGHLPKMEDLARRNLK